MLENTICLCFIICSKNAPKMLEICFKCAPKMLEKCSRYASKYDVGTYSFFGAP
jgi:hypothetical protein